MIIPSILFQQTFNPFEVPGKDLPFISSIASIASDVFANLM